MEKRFLRGLVSLCVVSMSFGLASCGDLSHFDDDLGIEGVSPHVVLPVARGSLSLWDVLDSETNDYLVVENGVLVVKYDKASILDTDIDVSDFFEMRSQNLAFGFSPIDVNAIIGGLFPSLTPGTVLPLPDTVKYDFSLTSDSIDFSEEVSVAELDFATRLLVNISPIPVNYVLEISFTNVNKGSEVLKLTLNGSKNQANSITEAYDELKTVLPADKKLGVSGKLIIPKGEMIDLADPMVFSMGMNLAGMDFIHAKGIFSQDLNVDIDEGSFSLANVDFFKEIGGTFKFTNPKASLSVKNTGIGIPVKVDFTLDGKNGSQSERLELNEGNVFTLTPNASVTAPVISKFEYNRDNSTIVDFISMPPVDDVSFTGKMKVDKNEAFDLWNEAKLGIGVDIEVPLEFEVDNMTYNDTITDLEIGDDVAKLKSGQLKFMVESSIPANLTMKSIRMLDGAGVLLFALNPNGAGTVLAGTESHPVKSSVIFDVDEAQMNQLPESVSIILDIAMSTDGIQTIKDSQKLNFKLLVGAEADLTEIID